MSITLTATARRLLHRQLQGAFRESLIAVPQTHEPTINLFPEWWIAIPVRFLLFLDSQFSCCGIAFAPHHHSLMRIRAARWDVILP
jgi:hypothetical protein